MLDFEGPYIININKQEGYIININKQNTKHIFNSQEIIRNQNIHLITEFRQERLRALFTEMD